MWGLGGGNGKGMMKVSQGRRGQRVALLAVRATGGALLLAP